MRKKISLRLSIFLIHCFLLTVYSFSSLDAQNEDELEDLIDFKSDQDIKDAQESGEISPAFEQQLQELYDNPIEINSADETDLLSLPGLELGEVQKIIQERLERGVYETTEDLYLRKAISKDDFEKIKLFIFVEKQPLLKKEDKEKSFFSRHFKNFKRFPFPKTKGELFQETVSKPERSFKTVSDLEGKSFSPTTDKTRIKINKIANRIKISASFLGDRFTFLENTTSSQTVFTTKDIQQYRWIKGSMGYDATSKGSFLQQFYLGNYRTGFFEGHSKERSTGFTIDDRISSKKRMSTTIEPRQSAPLKGVGAKFSVKKLSYSGFYSRDKYPARLSVLGENSTTGKNSISSMTVEDLIDLEIFGGYLRYAFNQRTHWSSFWISDRSELNLFNIKTELHRSNLWGLHYQSIFRGIDYRAIFSRIDKPILEGEERNFYFWRLNTKATERTKITLFYKRLDPGFISHAGEIFEEDYLQKFSFRIVQKIGNNLDAQLKFSNEEKNNLPARRFSYKIRWESHIGAIFQFKQSYLEGNVQEAVGIDRMVTTTASNELKSEIRAMHRQSKKIENRIDFELKSAHRQLTNRFQVSQKIAYRIMVQLSPEIQVQGELRMIDTDVNKPDTESRTFRLELSSKPFRKFNFRLGWENKFYVKNQTVVIENVVQDIDNPGYQNKINLRITYRW